jgi:sugar transferase (PEP-CTERM/EpsH1 system associated)
MHVLDRLDLGGTEKALVKLIRASDPALFEHCICTLRGTAETAGEWSAGVKVVNAGREGTALQFNVPGLVKLMKAMRPAVVHSRNWGGIEAIVAARLAGVPVAVHSEHGYQLDMRSGLPLRQRVLRHFAYRMATGVATVTDELRHYHAAQAWWKPSRITVLYNGVDSNDFRPQPQVRDAVRQRLGVPRDALVVGSVGRLVSLKDFTTLLQAGRLLAGQMPTLYVVIVGAGPELSKLRSYVDSSEELSGRVLFPGALDNVQEVLNAMDIFVLPSLMEGMSNTLLEALAVGLPVIATRVGGNSEVVAEGQCGYLFTPQDAPGLASLLRTLLRDEKLRGQFGSAARERAVRYFSLDAMIGRYRDLYIDLAMRQSALVGSTLYVRN